jgi:3-phosphoglycerate kinase
MAKKKEITVKYVDEVDIRGKTVFIRVDFNVPLDRNRNITDDTRIRAVLPTLNFALEEEAKVIVASHLGRPKGKPSDEFNMVPVARRLAYRLHRKVKLAPKWTASRRRWSLEMSSSWRTCALTREKNRTTRNSPGS